MTPKARSLFLIASTSLVAACAVSTEPLEASEDLGASTSALTESHALSLTPGQISRLKYLCENQFAGTTPELVSPGRSSLGQLTSESATWRRVSCVTDSVRFTYVWERALGGSPVRVTIDYDVASQTATTLNTGECERVLVTSHGASAAYTCREANDRLRVWMEGDTNVKFVSLHAGCNDGLQSRSNACTAAAHRYCNKRGYGGGITQEVGPDVFGVGCFHTALYRDATWQELRSYHDGCTDPQSSHCMAAVHRLCNASGYTGGLVQELGPGVAGIACFAGGSYQVVPWNEVPGCSVGDTSGANCTASAHRYCGARGFAGGLVQEVGASDVGVACFAGELLSASIK